MNQNNLLVIIVTYNAMKWVDKCFGSLETSTYPNDVFVVDNGSTDGTQEYIQKHYPRVMLTQSQENLGFGRANNIGLQYAIDNGYHYVYLLNQDAWVDNDVFETLVDLSDHNPEYGILSPMQITASRKKLDHNFELNMRNPEILKAYPDTKALFEVPFVMAAHWFIPVFALKTAGLFSSAFPHYGEDGNLCQRFQYWGYKIGVSTGVCGVHDREFRKEPTDEQNVYKTFIEYVSYINNPQKTSWMKSFALLSISSHTIIFKSRNASLKYKLTHIWKMIVALKSAPQYKNIYKCKGAFIKR